MLHTIISRIHSCGLSPLTYTAGRTVLFKDELLLSFRLGTLGGKLAVKGDLSLKSLIIILESLVVIPLLGMYKGEIV